MVAAASKRLTPFIASWFDRKDEWDKCIIQAMGYEWIGEEGKEKEANENNNKEEDNGKGIERNTFQILNLFDFDDHDDDDEELFDDDDRQRHVYNDNNHKLTNNNTSSKHKDMWMEGAERIQKDIAQMAAWIRESLQYSLPRVDLPIDEATLVSSTVTSFCATTAKEIETLRQLTQQEQQQQQQQQQYNTTAEQQYDESMTTSQSVRHRSGIVQILLGQLQEQVVEPFAKLQQQRQRKAIDLWQHPLQSCWSRSRRQRGSKNTTNNTDDQRFVPGGLTSLPPQELYDFLLKYKQTERIPVSLNSSPPVSKLFGGTLSTTTTATASTAAPAAKSSKTFTAKWNKPLQQSKRQPSAAAASHIMSAPDPNSDYTTTMITSTQQQEEELQREAAMLMAQMEHSDLDSVQQMEERMVEITTLLTQFASMVTEQQEDIVQIHQATVNSQDNIVKGKESLIDATHRTKQSKHYMATTIAVLAFLLWLWNALKP